MIDTMPVLEMRDVAKSYATPRGALTVLESVTLKIHPGEFVAITGPSGSGKTTFLNLAALMDQPTGGSILFDGDDVSSLDESALSEIRKSRIGMVFQNFYLLNHRTTMENVLFRFRYLDVDHNEARERAEEALSAVGLADLAEQPARLLSGGEMQRVAIARAVALRPRLLVADEPTGNLDRRAADSIMSAFTMLNQQGISVLLVTHNESLLDYCSRQLVCENGRLLERRTPNSDTPHCTSNQ